MKPNWQIKKLGEICDIKSSKRVHKSDWKTKGIPFYRAREIIKLAKNGFVNNDLFISEKLFEEFTKEKGSPQEGDIVVSAVGTLGVSYLVKKTDKFYFKDASVLWFENFKDVNSRYVDYLFLSELIKKQVMYKSMGATVGTLTITRAKNIKIPFPPLPEQYRIVKIVDEIFADIAEAEKNAEKNLQNSKKLFESYLQSIFTNPEYEIKSLGELCKNVEYGSSSKSKSLGKIPVLRMGNIQNSRFDWNNLVYSDNIEENKKYLLKYNDVLFNRTNSPELVGKTAIYKGERPAIFAGYLIRINRKEDLLDADYLNYFLNSEIARNYGKTVVISSVNQANINGTKLKTYPIPVPSLSEQKSNVAKLDALSAETKKLEAIYKQKLANLEELKKSVLKKAFAGEL